MRKSIGLFLAIIALVGGWYFVSPWLAMDGLRDAAAEVDRDELEQRIDFDAVRASMKDDLHERITEATEGQDEAVRIFGGAIATGLSDLAVNAAVTPTGVAGLITTGKVAAPLAPRETSRGKLEWSVDRGGFSAFEARSNFEDGGAGPTLRFARDGLSWKLVAIGLPENYR